MATIQRATTSKSKAHELGDHLRRFRVARDFTLRDVADRVGVKVTTVKEWEAGEAVPGSRDWARLKGMVARGIAAHSELWRAALDELNEVAIATGGVPAEITIPDLRAVAVETIQTEDGAQRLLVAPAAPAPEDAMTLGDALRRARLIEGLSQDDLGSLLAVEQGTVSKWELNHNIPVRDHFDRLVELFPSITRWRDLTREIPKPLGPVGITMTNARVSHAVELAMKQSDEERAVPRMPDVRHDAYFTEANPPPIPRDAPPIVPEDEKPMSARERLMELGMEHAQLLLDQAVARAALNEAEAAIASYRMALSDAERDLASCLEEMQTTISEIQKG